MIVVTYKKTNSEGIIQLPYSSVVIAIKKAKDLYKKGYLNVKVSEVTENVIFVPNI